MTKCGGIGVGLLLERDGARSGSGFASFPGVSEVGGAGKLRDMFYANIDEMVEGTVPCLKSLAYMQELDDPQVQWRRLPG